MTNKTVETIYAGYIRIWYSHPPNDVSAIHLIVLT